MNTISKKVGKYNVIIKMDGSETFDVTCDCMWSSLHPGAWQMTEKLGKNNKLCKHIKSALKKNGH